MSFWRFCIDFRSSGPFWRVLNAILDGFSTLRPYFEALRPHFQGLRDDFEGLRDDFGTKFWVLIFSPATDFCQNVEWHFSICCFQFFIVFHFYILFLFFKLFFHFVFLFLIILINSSMLVLSALTWWWLILFLFLILWPVWACWSTVARITNSFISIGMVLNN